RTVHRLLEYSLQKGGFQRNEDRPLTCDALIVDEVSMIDTVLMYHLLKAAPRGATLILVGDVNQLPSVGAGNVLQDLMRCGAIPVVALNEIFRQARQSRIVVNAHRINSGKLPLLKSPDGASDFHFIAKEDPEEVLQTIVELVQARIPRYLDCDPVNDIQVLTPMHKGVVGAANLNLELQKALNPGEVALVRGERGYRVGDKVMQIKNNYDKEVFNGDIGRIARVSLEDYEVHIAFDGREVVYDFAELDDIVLAYAVSVHKSQGSEYPAVIMPIVAQHYILLQRNLIYTAVTRGRRLVVLVGTIRALAMAVNNDAPRKRFTRLSHRLQKPG
ncbi:MAG: AAA family ATPase, partial [Desulfobacterales bacterium]|nr:AAA family ATPase [Desulfobacterales bacterium]